MTYNTSLKCTSRIVRVYTNTLRVGYGDNVYTDIVLDLVEGDTGHSVSIDSSNYIVLGANKHYVIFGLLSQSDDLLNQVIAVDESGTTLTEAEGFFPIMRNYGDYFPAFTTPAYDTYSTSYLRNGQSRNYTFKILKSTGGSSFKFKFRGFSQDTENLPIDSQVIIIEMSE